MAEILARLRNLSRTLPRLVKAEPIYRAVLRGLPADFEQTLAACRVLQLGPDEGTKKFLNLRWYLRENIVRAMLVGLDRTPPCRVLDLGCGPGYFLLACRMFGHDVTGLDLGTNAFYNRIVAELGLARLDGRIEAFQPPPIVDGPFDWITAFAVTFDQKSTRWGPAEWRYFIDALAPHLTPTGRLVFRLNRTGLFEKPSLEELFGGIDSFALTVDDYRSVTLTRVASRDLSAGDSDG